MKDTTTIQLSNETKKILDDLGKKGETYDDILRKIIKKYQEEIT